IFFWRWPARWPPSAGCSAAYFLDRRGWPAWPPVSSSRLPLSPSTVARSPETPGGSLLRKLLVTLCAITAYLMYQHPMRCTLEKHYMLETKRIIASGGGAVGLSMFASFIGLCCIGPWTVALLGVSGAVSVARWQPLRPYILAVAGAMLAWAFWRTY